MLPSKHQSELESSERLELEYQLPKLLTRGLQVGACCCMEASDPFFMGVSVSLLGCPHNIVADFP